MTAIDRRDGYELPAPGVLAAPVALVRRHAAALAWLMPVLLIGATASFVGIGGSPQRIDDEGTYVAQAWAVLNLGELAHYTYWYDHPPLGWLQIAGWAGLTGGFERYAIAVLAGREASIVATLVAAVLLFALARRVGLARPTAAAASLVLLLSPLAVQFHRTVYLDNIATPWLLAAFLLATARRSQLLAHAGAAVVFAIAVLTKETYLLALPFLIWVMLRGADRSTRRYTLAVAGTLLVLVGGGYLLFATVKGELMPGAGRVSLLDGVLFQLASRDGSGSPFDADSLMSATLGMWWQLDPVLIVAGVLAAVAGLWHRAVRPYAVMLLALALFMFRPNGYLPVPYVIMLIPFAALLVAAAGERIVRAVRTPGGRRAAGVAGALALVGAIVAAVPLWFVQLRGLVLADLDAPMRDAQSWIGANVPDQSRLIVDDAMWVDLVEQGRARENVVWYYKVDTDPAVQAQSPNGWRDADYVVATNSMRTFPDGFPQVQQAIDNSVVVAEFGQADQAVQIRRVLPQGLEAAQQELDDAAAAASAVGTQLVSNPALEVGDAAADLLTGGRVDERVMLGVAARLPDETITVGDFPVVRGEEELPRRLVRIDAVDGEPVVSAGRLTTAGERLIGSMRGAYAPESSAISGGGIVLTYPFQLPAAP
jgi:hypothetical protein